MTGIPLFAQGDTIFDSVWYYVLGGLCLVGLLLLLPVMLFFTIYFLTRGRDRDDRD